MGEQNPVASMPQFVYVLRLVPRFHDRAAWTDAERRLVGQHFERLAQGTRAGHVVLAGRTDEPLDRTFGLVIFESASEAEARAFMLADPAVRGGLMTAELHPYNIALLRGQP